MQKAISNKIQLGHSLNPLKYYARVPSINDEGNLENLSQKVDKVGEFWKRSKADEDLSRYFPNILPVTRQAKLLVNYQEKPLQALRIQIKGN